MNHSDKYSEEDYRVQPFLAAEALGNLLRHGCLNLFLGAGVSKGFGLPDWKTLIARTLGKEERVCLKDWKNKSSTDLSKLLDPVDDGSAAYHAKVHKVLYQKVDAKNILDHFAESKLLLAIAALLTGSCRGRINTVFTYNFDDLLEQYLKMLGYEVCVRTAASAISCRADVEINHVHGYLPQNWKPSGEVTKLVFSEKSFRRKRASIGEGWSSYVVHSMFSKVPLFVGLSGDDSSMHDIFELAKEKMDRNEDYHGYWLMTPDSYDGNSQTVLDLKMCPIKLAVSEIPKFIFAMCQEASASNAK